MPATYMYVYSMVVCGNLTVQRSRTLLFPASPPPPPVITAIDLTLLRHCTISTNYLASYNRIITTPQLGIVACTRILHILCFVHSRVMMLRTSLSSHKVGQLMSSVFHDVFLSLPGPIPATIIDFWQMVWQERPPTVVMVTNLKEGNKKKCEQYWPDSGSTTFGPFKVTLTEQQVFADYAIRMLLLTVRTVTVATPQGFPLACAFQQEVLN